MTPDLPTTARAEALRDHMSRHRPTDGFELVDVREEADEVAVVFRWRANPHTFVIGFDREFTGFVGEEMGGGLAAWCEDIRFWLMEELDTGLLARAERHRARDEVVLVAPPPAGAREDNGDEVVLVAPPPAGAREDNGIWVSDVPQFSPEMSLFSPRARLPWQVWLRVAPRALLARVRGRSYSFGWMPDVGTEMEPGDGLRDGEWLGEAGLDPARVREIRDEGRLLIWLQLMGEAFDDAAGGQCAVVATPASDVALVEVLEVCDSAPVGARQLLVDAAVHAAADLGARTLLVPDGPGAHARVDTALC